MQLINSSFRLHMDPVMSNMAGSLCLCSDLTFLPSQARPSQVSDWVPVFHLAAPLQVRRWSHWPRWHGLSEPGKLVLHSPPRWHMRTIRLGYVIHFARRSPRFKGIWFTSIKAADAPVLRAEISVLLAKDAIEPVPPADMSMELDSVSQTASFTQECAQSVLNCLKTLSGRTAVPLKVFQKLLGHVGATVAIVPLGCSI